MPPHVPHPSPSQPPEDVIVFALNERFARGAPSNDSASVGITARAIDSMNFKRNHRHEQQISAEPWRGKTRERRVHVIALALQVQQQADKQAPELADFADSGTQLLVDGEPGEEVATRAHVEQPDRPPVVHAQHHVRVGGGLHGGGRRRLVLAASV